MSPIAGSAFVDAGTTVTFGGEDAEVLSFISATEIRVSTPAHPEGIVDVEVTTTGGSDTLAAGFTYDGTSPTVIISAPEEAREPFEATVRFNEPVFGVEADDLSVGNGTITRFSGDGALYVYEVTPKSHGDVTLDFAAGKAVDVANNPNLAADQVTVNYIDEDFVLEQTQKTQAAFLSARSKILLENRPDISRRLNRLNGGYRPQGNVSALGLTYQDGRLPFSLDYGEKQSRFSYSLRDSRMAADDPGRPDGPSLRGSLQGFEARGHRRLENSDQDGDMPPSLFDSSSNYQPEPQRTVAKAERTYAFAPPVPGQTSGADGRQGDASDPDSVKPLRDALADASNNYGGPIEDRLKPLNNNRFKGRFGAGDNNDPMQHRFDLWSEGARGSFSGSLGDGEFAIVHFGADYLVTEDLLFGIGGQIDWVDMTVKETRGEIEGVGYMLGPYITTRLAPELFLDASINWGQSENDINPLGLYEDSFETERYLISGALIGQFAFGDLIIEPELRLSWFREETKAYSDYYGIHIPELTLETGTLSFGPTIRDTIRISEGTTLHPHLSLQGIWTFAQDFDASELIDTDDIAEEGLRGRVEFGVDVTNQDAFSLGLSGFYDGVADEEFKSWGGTLRLNGLF